MHFVGEVGNTFRLKRKSHSALYIILTKPNSEGKIVIVPLVKPIKSIQSYGIYTPRDGGNLFKAPRTPKYQDALLVSHESIINYVNEHLDMRDDDCPSDIVKRIITIAIRKGLSSNKILDELSRQYPDIK
jgi:hypothetical protein